MSIEHLRVPAEQLTKVCDPEELGFETTDEVAPLEGTIGQERAVSALEMGLNIDQPGFNIFVAGLPGTGRNTALRSYVERAAVGKPIPPDWGYVYNFQDPSQPVAISLPCGMMRLLKLDMEELVDSCGREIPRAFETEDYAHRVEEVMKEIQARRQALTDETEREAQAAGFTLTNTQLGITPVPMMEGHPITREEYQALSEEVRESLREKGDELQHSINHVMLEMRRLNKEADQQAREVDKEVVRFTLTPIIDELQAKYADHPAVVSYLDEVQTDMVGHIEIFKPREESVLPTGLPAAGGDEDAFVRYRVKDLVDNTECVGAPVVFESSPTYYNLFGRMAYKARVGTMTTDLTMLKAGSAHLANSGYLVVQARDLFSNPFSWEALKRTLRSGEVRIENIGEQYSPLPSTTLRPQPIPANIKVVVVGTPDILRLLQAADEDFRRFFKVTADFDTVMDRTPENMAKYASFVSARCKDGQLMPFDKTAVARVIDYSSRLVEHQEKLTTRFMDVADVVTEASYWALEAGGKSVTGEHVTHAIDQRRYRSSLAEDRLQEMIEDGTIRIATDGEAVGQVNGLSVLFFGDYSFGKPSRITARVSIGRGQLVNIERETRMSGKIHDKGFLTLTGYLNGKYGHDKPLSLSASIGFEQTYSEIDGDSASSTELYALLSELSGLPIKQGTAVTGSVNQAGRVQAIGGATQKIEGFYDLCKARGLDGAQGVMLPSDNLKHLVLKDEVVEAVRAGRFHVYGVSTIDEGIEILTGTPAGELDEEGQYPEGTVHHRVEERIRDLAQKARQYGKSLDEKDSEEEDKKPENEESEE